MHILILLKLTALSGALLGIEAALLSMPSYRRRSEPKPKASVEEKPASVKDSVAEKPASVEAKIVIPPMILISHHSTTSKTWVETLAQNLNNIGYQAILDTFQTGQNPIVDNMRNCHQAILTLMATSTILIA